MQAATTYPRISLTAQFLFWVFVILAISLLIFAWLMQPPLDEIWLMAGFLSATAAFSALAGYTAYRLGWMDHSPTFRWALLGSYALASFLTFINVWVTARLMFASQHDLLLATILLVFASGIAMALGYILSNALAVRIHRLNQAAKAIAEGRFDVQVPIQGRDELATLSQSFNEMAVQLQVADRKKQELEILRRDLIAWVSHDLQTPLSSIQAIVEALADGIVDDPHMVERYLNTAQRDIQSLSLLIDDLFQMAQLDAGGLQLNREYNSIADLLSDTLESFSHPALQQKVILQGSVSPEVPLVFMDAQSIGRVFNNLLSNALRHTPEGGDIQVNVTMVGEMVLVKVINHGEPIPPEDLPFIFDRFYRGEKSRNRSTGGSGLGLAIAKGIIEAHGGQIGVESLPGQTSFNFTLPINLDHHLSPP